MNASLLVGLLEDRKVTDVTDFATLLGEDTNIDIVLRYLKQNVMDNSYRENKIDSINAQGVVINYLLVNNPDALMKHIEDEVFLPSVLERLYSREQDIKQIHEHNKSTAPNDSHLSELDFFQEQIEPLLPAIATAFKQRVYKSTAPIKKKIIIFMHGTACFPFRDWLDDKCKFEFVNDYSKESKTISQMLSLCKRLSKADAVWQDSDSYSYRSTVGGIPWSMEVNLEEVFPFLTEATNAEKKHLTKITRRLELSVAQVRDPETSLANTNKPQEIDLVLNWSFVPGTRYVTRQRFQKFYGMPIIKLLCEKYPKVMDVRKALTTIVYTRIASQEIVKRLLGEVPII